MYMHPKTYLWLHEQDREHEATQAALERAARGGKPDDGVVRGGISISRTLDRARTAVAQVRAGPTSSSPLTGSAGA